ncbi:MAG TPA: hypothetical protein VMB80_08750 [Candidatus Acidoferrum sp.]|nr:hypothetical protein [Candidatus Acidoferrum sp.]
MPKDSSRQRYTSVLLVSLSFLSLILLRLQFWISGLGGPAGDSGGLELDSRLAGNGFYWWTDIVQALLALTVALTVLASLFSVRLSRRTATARQPSSSEASRSLPVCASAMP